VTSVFRSDTRERITKQSQNPRQGWYRCQWDATQISECKPESIEWTHSFYPDMGVTDACAA
jgi:hypothetical protein